MVTNEEFEALLSNDSESNMVQPGWNVLDRRET